MAPPAECYYNTLLLLFFVGECGVVHFFRAMRVFEVWGFGHHPHSLGYLCVKFRVFDDHRC